MTRVAALTAWGQAVLWNSELHGGRFLVNVPGPGNSGMVAAIDLKTISIWAEGTACF
jgi:hypothetical protein